MRNIQVFGFGAAYTRFGGTFQDQDPPCPSLNLEFKDWKLCQCFHSYVDCYSTGVTHLPISVEPPILIIKLPFRGSSSFQANLVTLQWRHNEHLGISNYLRPDCLLNRLFRCRFKENITKICITGLSGGNPLVTTTLIPSQRACNAENVSIWWCHHEYHSSSCCVSFWGMVHQQ